MPTIAAAAGRAAIRRRIPRRARWRTSPRSSRPRRVGVSPRAVVRRRAGARSRGGRPPDHEGGRVRAALRGRRRTARRRGARGSTRSVSSPSGNRGGAVKYFMKDMVGAPAAVVVDDAADAVDLAQARSRRPYAAVRRRGDDAVQDSASALRVDPRSDARDERLEDRSAAEGRRAGARGRHPRRTVPGAGRTNAQREARCPGASGRGVPGCPGSPHATRS